MFKRSGNEDILLPVKKSFAEGLDPAEYFVQQIGGRYGLIKKSTGTAEPGDIGKDLLAVTNEHHVTLRDCKTTQGIFVPLDRSDLVGRILQKKVSGVGGRGDMVTDQMISSAKKKGISSLYVRSPLTCEAVNGVCQKCYGADETGQLVKVGDAIGITDAQGVVDKISNLALKAWHLSGGKEVGEMPYERFKRLVQMPEQMADKAVLSTADGKVEKIEKNDLGGWDITVGKSLHRLPKRLGINPKFSKKNSRVNRGDELTDPSGRSIIKVQELLDIKGIKPVQEYMVDEMATIFKSGQPGGIRRKVLENITSAITGLGRVVDPGDSDFLPLDIGNVRKMEAFNKNLDAVVPVKDALGFKIKDQVAGIKSGTRLAKSDLKTLRMSGQSTVTIKKDGVKYENMLKPMQYLPIYKSDWLTRLNHKRLKNTLLTGAAIGEDSPIHGLSPIPPFAYGKPMANKDSIFF